MFDLLLLFVPGSLFQAPEPWPAEAEARAENLSLLDPGLGDDLSGAVWNPLTRSLWVCSNGPRQDGRLWQLAANAEGELRLASNQGRPGVWTGLGDCEGVTFADFGEPVVFLMVEGEEVIRELSVAAPGPASVLRTYDTSPFLPRSGSDGAEGITFVPDEHLTRAGFVDAAGAPRVSRRGMGGLMLVGHQNGGGIFAFDLDRRTGAVECVGEFRVALDGYDPPPKVVALEFERSTERLFVWHAAGKRNGMSAVELGSLAVPGESFRALPRGRSFEPPATRNFEGLAVAPAAKARPGERSLFLTVDDGGERALFHYRRFSLEPAGARAR